MLLVLYDYSRFPKRPRRDGYANMLYNNSCQGQCSLRIVDCVDFTRDYVYCLALYTYIYKTTLYHYCSRGVTVFVLRSVPLVPVWTVLLYAYTYPVIT
jgi:hypothetical protein